MSNQGSTPEVDWKTHEREVAEILGLSLTISSGNQFNDPGDGVTPGHWTESNFPLLVDCKATRKKSYSLERVFLDSWEEKARGMGKTFALPVRFEYEEGSQTKKSDWIALPLKDFSELLSLKEQPKPVKPDLEKVVEVIDFLEKLYDAYKTPPMKTRVLEQMNKLEEFLSDWN